LKNIQVSKTKSSIINLLFNYANVSFVIINGLILVPLYLTYFSVGTYGSYLSSGNIVGMLGLLEGGMSFVLTQKLSNCYVKKNFNEFSKILGSGLFMSLSIFLLLVSIGLILFPFISDWVKAEPNESENIQYAFLFSAIGAGLNIVYHNISSVFQALLKVSVSGFANIISIIVGIASTLLGLKFGLGVVAIPLGVLIRGGVGVFILVITLMKFLMEEKFPRIQIDKLITRDLVRSVLPMFGGGIAKSLVTNSQLLIITNFINPTASAIFFITGRIYQVCDSFLAPVGSSIFSSISQIVGQGNKEIIKKNIVKIFFIFNVFSVFILSLSFVFNSTFVSLLLGENKYGGNMLSLFLCVNMLFYTRFNFLSVNLYALGVFGKTIMYDVIGGLLRLIIIFSSIKYIGYIALPIAEFLSTTFLTGYFLNKLLIGKIELKGKEKLNFIFSGSTLFVIVFLISFIWIYFLTKINNWFLFVAYSVLIAFLNGIIILIFSKKVREMTLKLFSRFTLSIKHFLIN
jgi:O-antigen/teichoic acid export membrane protein